MLRVEFINDRIDRLRVSLNRLKTLATLDRDRFVANPDNFAIAEHHLRRSLEYLLDIGRHILAKQGLGRPEDYRSIIVLLGKHGVIPADFAKHRKRSLANS